MTKLKNKVPEGILPDFSGCDHIGDPPDLRTARKYQAKGIGSSLMIKYVPVLLHISNCLDWS